MKILEKDGTREKYPLLALGIDPGLSGSIALVSETWVYGMIDLELCKNYEGKQCSEDGNRDEMRSSLWKGKKNSAILKDGSYLNPQDVLSFLRPLSPINYFHNPNVQCSPKEAILRYTPQIVVMEDVHSFPGDGVASSFKFGQTKGLLTGIISCLFATVPHHYLKPNVWKLACGLSSNKEDSLDLACQIFKDQTYLFERKKDADRAEAALLGVCGLRILKSKIRQRRAAEERAGEKKDGRSHKSK